MKTAVTEIPALVPNSFSRTFLLGKLQRTVYSLAFILGMLLLIAANSGAQTTFTVPDDFPTIQAAINAANDGDTVLVAPGTYVEQLDFLRKSISLRSIAGPEVTTIDGNISLLYVSGPALLEGFTLRYGATKAIVDVSYSSPTIRGNIFQSDHRPLGYWGGAIRGFNGSSPVIEQNVFRHFTGGHAVLYFFNSSSPLIANNIFLDNECQAIYIGLPEKKSPKITNNTIIGNTVGIYVSYVGDSSKEIFKNNIVVGNDIGFQIEPYSTGGILPTVENNLVFNNGINYSGIGDQTGINGNISADPLFLDPVNSMHATNEAFARYYRVKPDVVRNVYQAGRDLGTKKKDALNNSPVSSKRSKPKR